MDLCHVGAISAIDVSCVEWDTMVVVATLNVLWWIMERNVLAVLLISHANWGVHARPNNLSTDHRSMRPSQRLLPPRLLASVSVGRRLIPETRYDLQNHWADVALGRNYERCQVARLIIQAGPEKLLWVSIAYVCLLTPICVRSHTWFYGVWNALVYWIWVCNVIPHCYLLRDMVSWQILLSTINGVQWCLVMNECFEFCSLACPARWDCTWSYDEFGNIHWPWLCGLSLEVLHFSDAQVEVFDYMVSVLWEGPQKSVTVHWVNSASGSNDNTMCMTMLWVETIILTVFYSLNDVDHPLNEVVHPQCRFHVVFNC